MKVEQRKRWRRKRSRAKTCYDLALNINYDKEVDKNMCEELGLNGIEEGDSDEMHATTVVDNVEISSCSTFSSETFKELGQVLKDNSPDMKQECENISMCLENSSAKDIVIKPSHIGHHLSHHSV